MTVVPLASDGPSEVAGVPPDGHDPMRQGAEDCSVLS